MLLHSCWMQEMHRTSRKVMEAAIPRSPIINGNPMQDGADLPPDNQQPCVFTSAIILSLLNWSLGPQCCGLRHYLWSQLCGVQNSSLELTPQWLGFLYPHKSQRYPLGFDSGNHCWLWIDVTHTVCVRRVWNVVFTSAWKFRKHSHTPTNHLVRFLK